MKETLELALSATLRPICPRHRHPMRYEAKGIRWKPATEDHVQTMPSYHCSFEGCSVRYDHMNGYFTLVSASERPFWWKMREQPPCNVRGMAHGCAGVRMREATRVLRGDAASMDAITLMRTSMDYSGFIQKEEKRQ